MRTIAIILSFALSTATLSSAVTPAFATKMNGKCCQSSDGGRSARYLRIMARRAIPHTCSAYAATCIRNTADMTDGLRMCLAAKAQCLQTGVHVGPYSGRHFAGMVRM
jgi:hypothetical protein